jgi:hypothetical protein
MKFNYYQLDDDGTIVPFSSDDEKPKYEHIPPGIYKLGSIATSLFSIQPKYTPIKSKDKLIQFKTGIINDVIVKARQFFDEKTAKAYAELDVCHKMGIILHGKPGTGKSCTSVLIMQELVEKHNAICVDATGIGFQFILNAIKKIRKISENPIVLFIDEFDNAVVTEEYYYLPFLDGNDSINNLLLIGCTNYIDKIPDRIKHRKSRVKHLFEINALPNELYKEYITTKLPSIRKDLLSKFAYLAEESALTIDQLKNAIIDYKIDRIPIKRAIDAAKATERIAATIEVDEEEEEEEDDWYNEDDDDNNNS